jgi:1,2-phenylacetyl-CoA epoxidase catalytic subunit
MSKLVNYTLLVGAVGIGLWIFFATSEVSVTNETKTETVIETQRVNELEEKIKEAVAGSTPAIEAKAQADYDATVAKAQEAFDSALAKSETAKTEAIANGIKAVEDKVKIDYIKEVEKTISDAGY